MVRLKELKESPALFVGFPVSWEEFAAESEFLRLAAIGEVEQRRVQQSGIQRLARSPRLLGEVVPLIVGNRQLDGSHDNLLR